MTWSRPPRVYSRRMSSRCWTHLSRWIWSERAWMPPPTQTRSSCDGGGGCCWSCWCCCCERGIVAQEQQDAEARGCAVHKVDPSLWSGVRCAAARCRKRVGLRSVVRSERGCVCGGAVCVEERKRTFPLSTASPRKLRMRLSPRQKETKASVACVRCSLGLAGASHHPSFGVWPAPEASSLLKYSPSDHPKGLKPPPNSQNTPPWYPNPHPSTTIHAHQPRHLP